MPELDVVPDVVLDVVPDAVRAIAETASELLGAVVGPDTDLLDSGATSITVIVLVGRVRRIAGDGLTPAVVLRGRTPREIASLAARDGAGASDQETTGDPARYPRSAAGRPERERTTGTGDRRAAQSPRWVTGLPITQYRMWYIEQQYPGAGDSAAPVLFRIRGDLHVDALERAVRYVVQRHEALRTLLCSTDGKYVEARVVAVHDTASPWDVLPVAPDDLPAALDEFLWQTFDLNHDLPVRARLFRIDPADHLLAMSLHHTAYDGWSDGVLARDLSAAYVAYAARATPDLPEAAGFHAVAALQTARAEAAGSDDEYWLEHLRGVPDLPLGFPPSSSTGSVQEVPVRLDAIDADQLRGACSRFHTTPSAIYLAAWVLALRAETGATDFAVGMPLAGRTVCEAENVIGCFASSAILRFPSSVGDGAECLRHGAGLLERAMTGQFMPLERLFWQLRPTDTGRNPFCQVGFVVQNNAHDPLALPGLQVERVRVPQRTSIFEMALVLWPGSVFGSYVWYRDDVVARDRAERLADSWLEHMARLCADPEPAKSSGARCIY